MIESVKNERVKWVSGLYKKRARDRSGLFLIEGFREVRRALENGVEILSLFVCDEMAGDLSWTVGTGADLVRLTKPPFLKISYRENPDGILAIAKQPKRGLAELDHLISVKKDLLMLISESVEKPGNLGALLRSADAAGVDVVVICDARTDLWNPNVVCASTGMVFVLPIFEADSDELLALLEKHGVRVIATTPNAKHVYTSLNLTGPVAVVVGTEHDGLSKKWLNGEQVKIPMLGKADSLNVATAATLVLYEVVRQRSSV